MNELYIPFVTLNNGTSMDDLFFAGSKGELKAFLESEEFVEFYSKDENGNPYTTILSRSNDIEAVEIDEHYIPLKDNCKESDDAKVVDITGYLGKLADNFSKQTEAELNEKSAPNIEEISKGALHSTDWDIDTSIFENEFNRVLKIYYCYDANAKERIYASFLAVILDAGEAVAHLFDTCKHSIEEKIISKKVCRAFMNWMTSNFSHDVSTDIIIEAVISDSNEIVNKIFADTVSEIVHELQQKDK